MKKILVSDNLLLVPWLILFGLIILTGSYRYYIAAFQVITVAVGLGLMLIVFIEGVLPVHGSGQDDGAVCCSHDHHVHEHDHGHGHPDGVSGKLGRLFLHCIPLVLYLAVGPQTLSVQAAAAKNPFLSAASGPAGDTVIPAAEEAVDYSRYDPATFETTDILKLYTDKAFTQAHRGAVIEGLVYKPGAAELPAGLQIEGPPVMLLHFMMICCAADCVPRVVLLENINAVHIPENTWLRVRGVPGWTGARGDIVKVHVLEWEPIAKPTYPYLLP